MVLSLALIVTSSGLISLKFGQTEWQSRIEDEVQLLKEMVLRKMFEL